MNLAPGREKKAGTVYDLPIFVGLLAADGDLPPPARKDAAFIGELSLTGALRGVTGVLPMALAARDAGMPDAVRPGGQRCRSNAGGGLDRLRRSGRGRAGAPT